MGRGRPRLDIVGKKYGRLEVIGESNRKGYVICKCECGNFCEVSKYSLTRSVKNDGTGTRSCGCLRKEATAKRGKGEGISMDGRLGVNKKYGTHYGYLLRKESLKSNMSSPHIGVCYSPSAQKYQAYITVNKVNHRLGNFKTYEEALNARLQAEEEYSQPLIDVMKEELEKKGRC